ncbi:MAG: hypothetical protein K8I29_16380 [Alphaproteobacteria bacterium]|uniref:eRF1 domain-containing protein n=1 Tax=Candidatus Nitrobium versatile TaxID=2884831 RepID=A0A953M2J0_9BACT|nr:hypothetical protein [Candidatus Nitrobium versatile]
MLDRAEVEEIASTEGKGHSFVSLYLNVDPLSNRGGDYAIHFKNMVKNTVDSLDKALYKKIKEDIDRINHYVNASKGLFKKGLALLSSSPNNFWKVYHLGVPVRNEMVVNSTPYVKPLLEVLDNYEGYAVLLVEKKEARIFVIHLGEIVEYGEVKSPEVPGRHRQVGWYGLGESRFENHINYHVKFHLKDVVEKLDYFLGREHIGRLILGGSDEAVSAIHSLFHKTVLDKVIDTVKLEMFATPDEVLRTTMQVISDYERKQEEETVEALITQSLKGKGAVIGLPDVISALQEQRVMKLVVLRDYKATGYTCGTCGFLSAEKVEPCPTCDGDEKAKPIEHIVDLAGELAVQQGAVVEVVSDSKRLAEAGGIGAFLRF